jgi:hypothetical protein
MPGRSTPLRWTSTFASLAMAVALAACRPELPPISWEGEVIRFGADDPDAVCGGTLEWMDARAVALKEVFGEGTHDKIGYYWIPQLWPDQPWCSTSAEGCVEQEGNTVYSKSVPVEHELVHALRRDRLPAVFEEGFAQLFGDIGWDGEPAPRDQLLTILERSDPVDFPEYDRASHFVAFLVETHGLDPLFRLAELGNYDDDYSKVRNAFAEAYGFSLDQALIDYEDFPECDPLAWMDKRIACAEPGQPLNPQLGADVEFSKNLDCGESDVYGPHGGFMLTETVLEIEPQIGLEVWIELIGDIGPDVSAALVSCGGCGDSTAVWVSTKAYRQQLELPPGRYVLRLFRPVDDPGELGISLGF